MKSIKYIIISLAIAITSFSSIAQTSSTEKFQKPSFDEISKFQGVTSIYLSKFMLKMAGNTAFNFEPRIGAIAKDLDSIEIIVCEDKTSSHRINKRLSDLIPTLNLETLAKINDEDEKVNIYGYPHDDVFTYLLMTVDDGDELIILSMSGNISIEKVAELTQ